MTIEEMTIYTIASIRKCLSQAGFGVPVTFLQQGDERDTPQQDEVQILTHISFPPRGGKTELYGIVNIKAVVKTKIVASDVYYHTRVKARVADILSKPILLTRTGGKEPEQNGVVFDKTKWGVLRKIPSETITITPTSIDVPDASLVDVFYEIQPC